MNKTLTAATAAAFLGSVVAANWAIANIGTQYAPGTPHVLPVWPGIEAPSGVYVVGVTLVLRDVLQRRTNRGVTFALIVVGAALSAVFSPALALASGLAFLISETVDLSIFSAVEPRWGFEAGVVTSNAVSIVVDSALFLWLAFGSLAFVEGQVIGKALATLAALLVIVAMRARRTAVA